MKLSFIPRVVHESWSTKRGASLFVVSEGASYESTSKLMNKIQKPKISQNTKYYAAEHLLARREQALECVQFDGLGGAVAVICFLTKEHKRGGKNNLLKTRDRANTPPKNTLHGLYD